MFQSQIFWFYLYASSYSLISESRFQIVKFRNLRFKILFYLFLKKKKLFQYLTFEMVLIMFQNLKKIENKNHFEM
jgi:hypothetical protein